MNTYAFCFTAIPHGSDPLRRQMDPSLYQTLLVPCNLTGKFDRYAPEIAGTAGLLRVVEVEFGGKTAWVPADCLRGPDGEAVDLEWMLNHTLADIANVSEMPTQLASAFFFTDLSLLESGVGEDGRWGRAYTIARRAARARGAAAVDGVRAVNHAYGHVLAFVRDVVRPHEYRATSHSRSELAKAEAVLRAAADAPDSPWPADLIDLAISVAGRLDAHTDAVPA